MIDGLLHAATRVGRWWGSFVYRAPDERSTCPACDATKIQLLEPMPLHRRGGGLRMGFVSGCRRCGLVFANPFPTLEELDDFYAPSGEFHRRRAEDRPSSTPLSMVYVRDFFRPGASFVDVDRPRPGGRVLDIGCGNGRFLDALQGLGWETWGIEPSDRAAFERHRELSEIPQDASFDVAILHHVLEHVGRPLDILRAVSGALRDGGVLAISVPRLDALPLNRDLRYCINSHTHVVSYTRDSLMTLLALAGMAGVDVSPAPGLPGSTSYRLRRLQMLGVKSGPSVQLPASPLAAARRAFRGYHAAQQTPSWTLAWPVRLRAARLNGQRVAAASGPSRRQRL